jgi:hypothetical protein
VKLFNTLVTNLAMNYAVEPNTQKDDVKPLYIMYSEDSFNEIGDPKVMQAGGADMNSLWEDTFYSLYKVKEQDGEERIEEKFGDKYKEPRFDEELVNFEKRNANLNNMDVQARGKKVKKLNK